VWDASAAAADRSLPLDTSGPTSGFDVMTQFSTVPSPGDWVVIDNQNGDDVYRGDNRAAIASVGAPPSTGGVELGKHRITLAGTKQFPPGYDGGRFVVVPAAQGPVFYVCANPNPNKDARGTGTGTLYRLSGYAFNGTSPTACPAVGAGAPVLATHVEQCEFSYNPNAGAAQDAGYMQIKLKITDQNESVQILFGTHADNVP
jgi:MSHA biogenesis protein MshO